MVAVISGNGLGWFNSSLAQTGRAHGGPGGLGQGNHSAMVNIANGNLMLAGNDEQASFNGFNLNVLRTYNSQGESAGSAGRWSFSFETRLEHVPPLASPGGKDAPAQGLGTFYRHAADGSITEYVWDAARGASYSSDGDGAADFVRLAANNTFEWVDGSTREVQVYDSEGRLVEYVDKSGNAWSIRRESWGLETPIYGKIIGIDSATDSIAIEYGDFGEITALDTWHNGQHAHRVEYTYGYDVFGYPSRIATVRTQNLSGSGHFETTYTYESPTSDRIVRVSQSDGAEVSFSYDTQGRISQVRRGSGVDAPQSKLTYTYDTANRRTTVTDDAGQSWVYAYDAEDRLTTVTQPAVNGQRAQTRYTYDTRGNVLSIQQGRLNVANTFVVVEESSFEYDSNDNLRWERDRLGNSVERLYNANNQLTRLTRFLDVDTDGAGSQRPEQGVSTQFIYDAQSRLRYEIDATGNMVRYQVNSAGQVTRRTAYISANYTGAVDFASLETWATNSGGQQQIVDYTYDFRGLLAFEEQYSIALRTFIDSDPTLRTFEGASVQASVYLGDAGAKFIAYTYDPQGLLRQVINYRGDQRQTAEVMSMSYDGMGRLLTQVDAQGRTTSTVYNDAAGTITTTFANGLRTRNEVRDSHGRVVSVTLADTSAHAQGGPRLSQNYYDALGRLRASEDAAGGRSYLFYDQAGRIEAEVDATGTVTRYVRDHAGRVLTATTYAQQVETGSWIDQNGQFVGVLTLPAPNASLDRVVTSGYDSAGRLSHTVDGEGTRSNFIYDGANQLIRTQTFNDNNNNSEIRRTRNFYDPAGRLIGTLDADNFLVEHIYDRAGRLTKTIRYAVAATDSTDTAGLGKLRPAINTHDQITRFYYNGRGERIATLDAELYLTHSLFSETANQLSTLRYSKRVQLAVDDGTTLSALLNHLQTEASTARTETQTWNSAGDLVQSNSAGLLTTYQYNGHGQLESTSELDIDDLNQTVVREQRRRLNGFGQVVAELPASALDNEWHLAITHQYDARGLRVQTTDAEGNHTWYFYDGEGRLTHELRGQPSPGSDKNPIRNARVEVTETVYNAFGQAQRTIAYNGLISVPWPYDYNAARTVVQSLNALPANPNNTRVEYTYDRRGLLRTATDPVSGGIASTRIYDDFGALKQQKLTAAIRGVLSEQVTTYSYNARGMLTGESLAHVSGAQNVTLDYDAFGRVTTRTDAQNQPTVFEYDRLGRQVSSTRLVHVSTATAANQSVAHRTEVQTTTYDAFSRVLTETDTKGGVTTYTYEANGTAVNDLRVNITTHEGVSITTFRNHRGSTLRVEDAAQQTTRYYYDADGRLKGVRLPDGSESNTDYDVRGLVYESEDATGRTTRYTYDAAGRVLTRTENAQATNTSEHLITRYAYDGQGRQIRVTDASGKLTTYEYWQDGQIKSVTRGDRTNPAAGLEITSYTYDARGKQLTVVQGEGAAQRTTQYQYDEAGRRVEELVDPAGLRIRTAYEYDANGNLIARHNPAYAAGSSVTDPVALATPPGVTRMVYDDANRLVFSIDPTGAVTQYHYDTNGQLTWTRAYATRPGLPAQLTLATMLSAVNTVANAATDVQSYIVRDRDGRERFILNADGSWTQYIYNSLGQRHQTLVVGQPNFTEAEILAIRRGDSLHAGVELDEHLATRFDLLNARRNLVVFDALGRPAYTLTPDGQSIHATVSRTQYDAAGRVIAETQYGKRILLSIPTSIAIVEARLNTAGALTADQNRQTHYVYDGAGRLQYTVSETDYRSGIQYYAITEQRYDGAGRLASSHVYRDERTLPSLSAASISAALLGQTAAITRNEYDAAGRLKTAIDALDSTEHFEYDATGNLSAYTNKEGYRWTYEVDGAGRRTREKSPEVSVSFIDANGVESLLTRPIYTRTVYDALGNVVRRVEDENRDSLPEATFRTRTTDYVYDARGLQIQTRFPNAGQLDSNGRELIVDQNAALPTLTVTYDALGRAVVQQDVRGFYSYKIYDAQGRLRYEVDQERFVTAYTYTAYGEQASVVRHANPIAQSAIPANGAPLSLTALNAEVALIADSARDRKIEFQYDRLGRKTSAKQSAVVYYDTSGFLRTGQPETSFTYDAYGRLIKEAVLLESGPSVRWAETFHWYDEAGRRIRTVDAERYVTAWTHDAQGRVKSEIQYARQLDSSVSLDPNGPPPAPLAPDSTTGANRVFTFQYDALGRRTHETRLVGTTTEGFVSNTTHYTFDREGRLKTETQAYGTANAPVSVRNYDALGRLVELRDPARLVFEGDLTNGAVNLAGNHYVERIAATNFAYDAFGNAIRVVRAGYSRGAGDTLVNPVDTRETRSRYDWQGRLIWTQEGLQSDSRKISWRYYDAADNVRHEVSELKINHDLAMGGAEANQLDRVVNSYIYDGLGRQTETDTVRQRLQNGVYSAYYGDSRTRVIYNAFGEIVDRKLVGDDATPTTDHRTYDYDQAGRLRASNDNEQGLNREHGYNLAGHKVYEKRASLGGNAIYIDATDRLGRATQSTSPRNTDDTTTALPVVSRVFDRWGNVLTITDARNNRTDYRYNTLNLISREEKAEVTVVGENGQSTLGRPVSEYFYDIHGRLKQTRDANGVDRFFAYAANGDLQTTTDGEGAVTRFAYNSLGEEKYVERPADGSRGQVLYRNYDDRGRLTEVGDYTQIPNSTAYQQSMQQRYVLNQDGHRLAVTDAMAATQRFAYNSRGEVTVSRTAMGVQMSYRYDEMGRKVYESYDGLGSFQTWEYRTDGTLQKHLDLSGRETTHHYANGFLERVTRDGSVQREIQYYKSGLVKRVTEGSNWSEYQYDAAGNLIQEINFAPSVGGSAVHLRTRIAYDSNGRIETVKQRDLVQNRTILDLAYTYDAVGNRRSISIRPGNEPPIFAPNQNPPALNRNQNFSFDILATDANGDALTYRAALIINGQEVALPAPTVAEAAWLQFGQTQNGNGQRVARFSGRAPTIAGSYQLRVYARDAGAIDGGEEVVANYNLVINNSNALPQFHPGASLTRDITPGEPFQFYVGAVDPDGDSIRFHAFELDAQGQEHALPFGGLATMVGTDGSYYANFFGTAPTTNASYRIRLYAREESTNQQVFVEFNVRVTAPNTAPSAGSIPNQEVNLGANFTLNLAPYFSDPDVGQSLTYSIISGPAGLGINGTWLTGQPSVPPGAYHTVTVRATDNGQPPMSVDTTFKLRVVSGLAVTRPIPDQYVRPGDALPVGWAVWGYFSDPAGLPLTFSAQSIVNGVPQALPPGLAFSTNGAFTGSFPAAIGQYRIRVTASNGTASASTDFTIHVTATNVAPTVSSQIPTQSMQVGQITEFYLDNHFTDPDGPMLNFWVATSTPSAAGATVGDRSLRLQPSVPGSYTITVYASDGQNPPVPMSFTLNVQNSTNQAPVRRPGVNSYYEATWRRGVTQFMQVPVLFQDPEGQALTYEVVDSSGTVAPYFEVSVQGNFLLISGELYDNSSTVGLWVRARDPQDIYNLASANVLLSITLEGIPPVINGEVEADLEPSPIESEFDLIDATVAATGAEWTYSATTAAPSAAAAVQQATYWFTYDNENRVRISNGFLSNGVIRLRVQGGQFEVGRDFSVFYTYDKSGNIQYSVRSNPGALESSQYSVSRFHYDQRNQLLSTRTALAAASDLENTEAPGVIALNKLTSLQLVESERRGYDPAGRLIRVDEFFVEEMASWSPRNEWDPIIVTVRGLARATQRFEYDLDGRITRESRYDRKLFQDGTGGTEEGQPETWLANYYASQGNAGVPEANRNTDILISDAGRYSYHRSSTQYASSFTNPSITNGVGYDAGGRLKGFLSWSGGDRPEVTATKFTQFTMTYEGWDGWVEKGVTGTLWVRNSAGQLSQNNSSRTTHTLDSHGRRIGSIEERRPAPGEPLRVESRTDLGLNSNGQIVARAQSDRLNNTSMGAFTRTQFAYAAGQQVAQIYSDGTVRITGRHTGFSSGANGAGRTVVYAGETLRSIAQRVYGDDSLWFVLASANGLEGEAPLTPGSSLDVPQRITQTNSAGTFRPYNASETAGIELPAVGYIPPAPKASCNPLQIVMIVVAVVVTIYTAGAAAGVMANASVAAGTTATVGGAAGTGAFAAGTAVLSGSATVAAGGVVTAMGAGAMAASAAIGGFAGSVASQLVGRAMGVTDSFSLRQAVGSGLTAGLTAGAGAALSGASGTVGRIFGAGDWRSAAAYASVNTLTGHAGARMAGLDNSFSWRSVAANAVTASISSSVTGRLGKALNIDTTTVGGQFGQDLMGGAVGGIVGIHTRRAAGMEQGVDYGQVAVDAFGNAIANALTGEQSRRADAALAAQAKALVPESLHGTVDRMLAGVKRDRSSTEFLDFVSRFATNAQASGASILGSVALGREYLERFANISGNDRADAIAVLDMGFGLRSGSVQVGALQQSFGVLRTDASTFSAPLGAAAQPWLGHVNLDSLLVGTGEVATIVGQEIESRWYLKYSLLAAEVAAGPVLYAGRTAVGAAFQQQIEGAQEAAIGWAGGHLRAAGRTESESVSGGVGTLALGALAAGGIGGALLKLKSVSSRLDGFLENMSSGPSSMGPGRQWGAIFPNGERPSGPHADRDGRGQPIIQRRSFDNVDDFNRAARNPLPNTRYEHGGFAWTTDSRRRVVEIEGMATPTSGNPRYRTPGTMSQADLGKVPGSQPGDVGFHLVGHQFGGPINPLNVVPGNGQPLALAGGGRLTNINQGRYSSEFEAAVAQLSRTTGAPVPVRISVSYGAGNTSVRPDAFVPHYQLPDGTWRSVRSILNRAGG